MLGSECAANGAKARVVRSTLAGLMAAALALPAVVSAQTIAITGGRVFPVSGPSLENATVLIEDGEIVAVGTDVSIPAGASLIHAAGKWVTPGLISGFTQLGLVEISAVSGTNEASMAESDISAAFNVLGGINPASQLIPVTRVDGITTVLSAPSGGLIAGQAVLIDLHGESVEEMLIASPAAMVAALDEGAKDSGGGSRAGSAGRLRKLLDDALDYEARRDAYRRGETQELAAPAADLEALLRVLEAEIPLLVAASRRSDIEAALRVATDYGLQLILRGAEEGWQVADRLAELGVPVIIDPLANIPSYDAPSPRLDNAAALSGAGVPVIIMAAGFQYSHNARNVRQGAGHAVSYGMGWDAALRAVTLEPATAFGIADRYGSLEPGKVANVVVWSGDPFEFSTAVEAVFIRGEQIPLTSRQRELLERYKTLPPAY